MPSEDQPLFRDPPRDPPRSPPAPDSESQPPSDPAPAPDGPLSPAGSMTLGGHLEELRRRLLLCLIFVLPLMIAGMAGYRYLWELLLVPAKRALAGMGKPPEELGQYFMMLPQGPTYPLFAVARLALYASLMLVLPWILCQLWIFVSPGLRAAERNALRRIFSAGAFLFAAGVAAGWMYGAPAALRFLLPFSADLPAVQNLYTIDEYLSFITRISIAFGIAFETPLVMWALAKSGLLRAAHLRRRWRLIVLGIFVVAAILTPPEPFSQLLLAAIFIILTLGGYGLVKMAERPAPTRAE